MKHSRYRRVTLLINPDTPQVETVKVDEPSLALRLLDAFHLTFTRGKHLFMLERASVTTAQAHTRISPLGRRISIEWCMWWLQQHGGQQQYGQLFDVLCLVRVAIAVCSRTRSDVVRKWPDGQFVVWSTSVRYACGV